MVSLILTLPPARMSQHSQLIHNLPSDQPKQQAQGASSRFEVKLQRLVHASIVATRGCGPLPPTIRSQQI